MNIFNLFFRVDINEGINKWREQKGALLVDVRTREEYADGHIAGSRNIPLDEIDRIKELVADKNAPLFVHCQSGARSARAVAYLKANGYKAVHDIGGIGSYRGKII